MSTSRFLAGALVGLITGLLIAPEKGSDLRDEIAETAENLKRKLYKAVGKTSAELADLKAMLEDEVEGLGDDVRQRLLAVLNDTAARTNSVKKAIAKEIHS